MSDLEDEKIELIMKKDKLEEGRAKLDKTNVAEDERIGKEIKEIHAKIGEINKKIKDSVSLIE